MLQITSFWKGFHANNNFIVDIINNNNITLKSNLLISGSFINFSTEKNIRSFKGKKILFITEPIAEVMKNTYNLYNSKAFDYVCGCINNDGATHIKYPLYLLYHNFMDPTVYINANNYTKTTNISVKKFACLINRHDRGHTRSGIYKALNDLKSGTIVCPGKLYNNCSNVTLDKIGKEKYMQDYLFNICPENYNTLVPGYVTEKLLQACLSGAIPIYYGKLDDIDKKIFNLNRIIIFDPFNKKSINDTANFIKELMSNKTKLELYYRQNPFCDTAHETAMMMHNNFVNLLKLC